MLVITRWSEFFPLDVWISHDGMDDHNLPCLTMGQQFGVLKSWGILRPDLSWTVLPTSRSRDGSWWFFDSGFHHISSSIVLDDDFLRFQNEDSMRIFQEETTIFWCFPMCDSQNFSPSSCYISGMNIPITIDGFCWENCKPETMVFTMKIMDKSCFFFMGFPVSIFPTKPIHWQYPLVNVYITMDNHHF